MGRQRVVVVGAGVAGLVAALQLAARDVAVTVVERAAAPGGKMREVDTGAGRIDSGPTVFTMPWVFEEIFAEAGTSLDEQLTLQRADILARHAWSEGERLDLFADVERSAEAIGEFAGAAEMRGYRRFCERAGRIYRTLDQTFIHASRPNVLQLVGRVGLHRLPDLWNIAPYATMWRSLGEYFRDPRLQQLFGRYATYCGSSPFAAPATLMLVAHVEQRGVWLVEGGMHRVPQALARLAAARGADFRYGAEVAEILVKNGRAAGVRLASGDVIEADAVISNADVAALADGLLGGAVARATARVPYSARSLSALTWSLCAVAEDFPLVRHTVFFSADYASEFQDLMRHRRLPKTPTVYVCAQDRGDDAQGGNGAERLFLLVNAPPTGDTQNDDVAEIEQCEERTFHLLARCGLRLSGRTGTAVRTTPAEFNRMFPATGGALYGQASHGWRASFRRPGSRSRIPGLYLTGGSTHPGAGVPMAALSGRLAASSLLADSASIRSFPTAAMPGGTSTP